MPFKYENSVAVRSWKFHRKVMKKLSVKMSVTTWLGLLNLNHLVAVSLRPTGTRARTTSATSAKWTWATASCSSRGPFCRRRWSLWRLSRPAAPTSVTSSCLRSQDWLSSTTRYRESQASTSSSSSYCFDGFLLTKIHLSPLRCRCDA